MTKSKLMEMNNVGIVVESLDNAISFFTEIGLKLEGRAMVEGEWAGRVTGLGNQSVEIAMMVTPDGHSRLELSRFLTPHTIADHRTAPVNSLGYLRIMFRVDNLDELLSRLVSMVLKSLEKWLIMRTFIGFATFVERKDFLSD
jgi:catechol 2,3-dioxygenase-like lactoylglutathione lyase family enzyme